MRASGRVKSCVQHLAGWFKHCGAHPHSLLGAHELWLTSRSLLSSAAQPAKGGVWCWLAGWRRAENAHTHACIANSPWYGSAKIKVPINSGPDFHFNSRNLACNCCQNNASCGFWLPAARSRNAMRPLFLSVALQRTNARAHKRNALESRTVTACCKWQRALVCWSNASFECVLVFVKSVIVQMFKLGWVAMN
jgi:hypothetical protein